MAEELGEAHFIFLFRMRERTVDLQPLERTLQTGRREGVSGMWYLPGIPLCGQKCRLWRGGCQSTVTLGCHPGQVPEPRYLGLRGRKRVSQTLCASVSFAIK